MYGRGVPDVLALLSRVMDCISVVSVIGSSLRPSIANVTEAFCRTRWGIAAVCSWSEDALSSVSDALAGRSTVQC